MALVLAIDRPEIETSVYLTKSEIIRVAKEYSDSSYEHSEKGTYFTAWAGMKSLVGKGLVYMTGNPNKFCLTEEG
jgi:crossover junction endonuclease MUS81